MRRLRQFLSNADGATAIEYAMIGAVISIAIVIGATAIGSNLVSKFTAVLTGFH